MPTHDPKNPRDPKNSQDPLLHRQESNSGSKKAGYELADANVKDTAIFLVIMGASIAVVFVLAFGIGKLLYYGIARQDGPPNKWSQASSGVKPGDLVSNPKIEQQQLQRVVKTFPTPRLQTDDGNMDVAEMHAREDMLLNHYTWVDEQKQTVRIPIERAMELVAKQGLPVEGTEAAPGKSAAQESAKSDDTEKHMFGDGSNTVTAPLTDGFARTGPELKMIEAKEQQMEIGSTRETQAEERTGR